MGNKAYAKEWLVFGYRHMTAAKLLFKNGYYEDIIGIELQQALEKFIKAVMADKNSKIPKEHDLVKLYFLIENELSVNDKELILLRIATDYYKENRYPNYTYNLPDKEEIKQVLLFCEELFSRVCSSLGIKTDEVIDAR